MAKRSKKPPKYTASHPRYDAALKWFPKMRTAIITPKPKPRRRGAGRKGKT